MPDDHSTGDPIPEVFDPDRIDARFVVAMSIARNDIDVALRDGIAAAHDDRPDFAYRGLSPPPPRAHELLREEFGIEHTTLQVEHARDRELLQLEGAPREPAKRGGERR
jgi:hypothetical protein